MRVYVENLTGCAIQGSREKVYQELGLDTLKSIRWYRRLCCMYKIMRKSTSLFN